MRAWSRSRLAPVGLVLLAAAAYANGLTGGFIWDDRNLVLDPARVHGLSHLPELLGIGTGHIGFRLLRDLSYAIDYSLGGPAPWVFHVSNLAYHGLVVWLVWRLALCLGLDRIAAFWAGAVFAVHPVHVDAVTYIAGRRDLLSSALYLGSVLAFARYRDDDRRGWLVLAAVLGTLGVSAKEMAATVPAAWFLYDAFRLGEGTGIVAGARRALARHWRLYGAGIAVAAACVAYVVVAQRVTLGAGPMGDAWGTHARTEATILAYAVRLLLVPAPLLIDYQHFFPPVTSMLDGRLALSVALLAGLATGAAVAFRGRPAPAFAAHWVWLTYLPVMQIVPHPERFAEHYLYLPSVGAALLSGMGVGHLAGRPRVRAASLALATAAVLLLGAGTWHRNRDFRSEIKVFEAALRVHPRAPRVWNNLALAYEEAGDRERAIRLLLEAMDSTRDPLLTANLAGLLGRAGRSAEALPWLLDARARYPGDPALLEGLGRTFYRLGRLPDARRAYTDLLAAHPGDVDALVGLGNTARALGDAEEAERRYRAAVRRDPARAAAWTGLGIVLQARDDAAGAREAFERVLALDPEDGNAWNNLGVLLLTAGDARGAEAHFARAVAVPEVPPAAWLNLARVRVNRGDCAGGLAALDDARAAGADLPPEVVRVFRARARACPPPGAP